MRVRMRSQLCFDIPQEFTLRDKLSLLDMSTFRCMTSRNLHVYILFLAVCLVYAAYHQEIFHMRYTNGDPIRERSTFVEAAATPNW